MSFPIVVDCQPGHGGESVPRALHFGLANVTVKALVDSWAGRDHCYFKLPGEDGATYYDRGQEPAG